MNNNSVYSNAGDLFVGVGLFGSDAKSKYQINLKLSLRFFYSKKIDLATCLGLQDVCCYQKKKVVGQIPSLYLSLSLSLGV